MHDFLIFLGKKALSDFRLHKLQQELSNQIQLTTHALAYPTKITHIAAISARAGIHNFENPPSSIEISCHEIYLVKANLDNKDIQKIEQLLNAKKISELTLNDQQILVAPRLGTTSPWSSKATEIAKRCGLDEIEIIEKCTYFEANEAISPIYDLIHDKMIESTIKNIETLSKIFHKQSGSTFKEVDISQSGIDSLKKINVDIGLALSDSEINYLFKNYQKQGKNPTDIELMMFAQANSEHCRHKIFNADFIIDDKPQDKTMFQLIKDTYKKSPQNVLVAYNDNSSVIAGTTFQRFYADSTSHQYNFNEEETHVLMKVETHNHPTAIEPFAGAATGSGGEIRDEGATGRGSKPKAGLSGFTVSYLNLPNTNEISTYGKPQHIKSALDIMLQGPIGSASFNNEFGRPNLCGYFRSFEQNINGVYYGYHKPIMIAGGYGNINAVNVKKSDVVAQTLIIQIGGPGFLIGLGGGSISSMAGGDNKEDLDFNSVQRANPEIERRAQEVIDACSFLGTNNPILSIHDVGAGGLSNAVPELVHGSNMGGEFELRKIPIYDENMSPLEIWCNESQERYVLAIRPEHLEIFAKICARENCPYSILGTATPEQKIVLHDDKFNNNPINIESNVLFGSPPKTIKNVKSTCTSSGASPRNSPPQEHESIDLSSQQILESTSLSLQRKLESTKMNNLDLKEAIYKVLSHPTVASKSFLITIGDRSVGGHTIRDQMVGKWQVPVADCAITAFGYTTHNGEAMSMGERTPLATLNPEASGRMAVAESLTNLASCYIKNINDVKLSANWMASSGSETQDVALYNTVRSVSELCQKLNIAIPVGKDSLAMKMRWEENNTTKEVISPVSLIVSAFATTPDGRRHKTPELEKYTNSTLILISLNNKIRLGGSILQECYHAITNNIHTNENNFEQVKEPSSQLLISSLQLLSQQPSSHGAGSTLLKQHDINDTPDIDDAQSLANLFSLISRLHQDTLILAYHDKSDGGMLATICEMIFASRIGITLNLATNNIIETLFNEEIGIVLQVKNENLDRIHKLVLEKNLLLTRIGEINLDQDNLLITNHNKIVINEERKTLQQTWNMVSHKIQKLRDNPECADSELKTIEKANTGLFSNISFDLKELAIAKVNIAHRPRIAILREQGVNGHIEMAAAFTLAGFEAIDVHMNDLLLGNTNLKNFTGLVACGGFSYGDVLGAGLGWANSILFNQKLKDEFTNFFNRRETFSLGVCNGCQMMANLRNIIPGAEHFPLFKQNISAQFEARLTMVQINNSSSILFKDMHHSQLPIIVSHGEGLVTYTKNITPCNIALQYIDYNGHPTEDYPYNPNGSLHGVTGITSTDGRCTIMMPHPERIFRTQQMSWHDTSWGEISPWFKMFKNAYAFTK